MHRARTGRPLAGPFFVDARTTITFLAPPAPGRPPSYRGSMLRDTLLYLSNQPRVFKFVRNSRMAKHFAKRFVPGETLAEALEVVRGLNARGISASLDFLGESTSNEREARARDCEPLLQARPVRDFRQSVSATIRACPRQTPDSRVRSGHRRDPAYGRDSQPGRAHQSRRALCLAR